MAVVVVKSGPSWLPTTNSQVVGSRTAGRVCRVGDDRVARRTLDPAAASPGQWEAEMVVARPGKRSSDLEGGGDGGA